MSLQYLPRMWTHCMCVWGGRTNENNYSLWQSVREDAHCILTFVVDITNHTSLITYTIQQDVCVFVCLTLPTLQRCWQWGTGSRERWYCSEGWQASPRSTPHQKPHLWVYKSTAVTNSIKSFELIRPCNRPLSFSSQKIFNRWSWTKYGWAKGYMLNSCISFACRYSNYRPRLCTHVPWILMSMKKARGVLGTAITDRVTVCNWLPGAKVTNAFSILAKCTPGWATSKVKPPTVAIWFRVWVL